MKDSKVRSSIVPVTMSRLPNVTRSLNCEITVLSTEAEAKESYILDVENSLRLNKQASNIMFGEQIMKMKGQGKLLGRFRSVSWENMRLLEELSKERRSKEEVLAESLIIEQIRVQQQQYFEGLVEERAQRIQDLRKTYHDKQYNYSVIAEKLARFEDLEDIATTSNHVDAQHALQDRAVIKTIAKLSREKEEIVQQIKNSRDMLRRLQESEEKTKDKLIEQPHYSRIMELFRNKEEVLSEGNQTTTQKHEVQENAEPTLLSNELIKNESFRDTQIKELIKLLKRAKLNSQIMKLSLKESHEICQKMQERHRTLVQSAKAAESRMKQYQNKIDHLDKLIKHRMFPWIKPTPTATNNLLPTQEEETITKNGNQQLNIDSLLGNTSPSAMLIRCGSQPSFCNTTAE